MRRNGVLRCYSWNLQYAEALVADLSEDDWARSAGAGLENHPAWTLGHLVSGSDILAEDLGLPRDMPAEWVELFERRGPGDPRLPESDPAAYPSRDELLAELRRQHKRVTAAWLAAEAEGKLDENVSWRFDAALPTLGDVSIFLAITHEAMHLGQIACWRRAHGLPSALATM